MNKRICKSKLFSLLTLWALISWIMIYLKKNPSFQKNVKDIMDKKKTKIKEYMKEAKDKIDKEVIKQNKRK